MKATFAAASRPCCRRLPPPPEMLSHRRLAIDLADQLSGVRAGVAGGEGSADRLPELIEAIQEFIRINNQNPKPFVWTKNVDEILEKVGHCKAVTKTLH